MATVDDSLALAQLVTKVGQTVDVFHENVDHFGTWSAGTATGGPSGDGYYPLPVKGQPDRLVPCPAKIAAIAEESGSESTPLTAAAIVALNQAVAKNVNGSLRAMPIVPGVDEDGNLVKVPLGMFTSRKTADLIQSTKLTGLELLPAITEAGPNSQERKIALTEIHRTFTGVINPKLPPYNCKGDLRHETQASTLVGSNVITIQHDMFRPEDVGKLIYVSNNTTGGNNYQSTITQYLSPTQVRCAHNFTANRDRNCELAWGTDDTAGLQAAIYACRSPGPFTYGGVVLLPPGAYLTSPLKYVARMAIKGMGRRQSFLYRKPAPPGVPDSNWMLSNETTMDDFNILQDFGMHGLKFLQNSSFGGLGFFSVQSNQVTAQNDPYPFWSNLAIIHHAWHGVETYHRHSGDIIAMEIDGCFGAGFHNNSYDINMVNMLAIGNWGPGMIMNSGGCNMNNLKLSFNGVNGYWLPGGKKDEGGCNLLVGGGGNNLTNVRLQESNSSNLIVTGRFNKFGHIGIEDTGCIIPHHNTWDTANLPPLRAAIHLKGAGCIDNIFMDGYYGRAVHDAIGNDDLTHAIFTSGDASNNHGRLFERTNTQFGVSRIGTSSSGGYGASNDITINGVLPF